MFALFKCFMVQFLQMSIYEESICMDVLLEFQSEINCHEYSTRLSTVVYFSSLNSLNL